MGRQKVIVPYRRKCVVCGLFFQPTREANSKCVKCKRQGADGKDELWNVLYRDVHGESMIIHEESLD